MVYIGSKKAISHDIIPFILSSIAVRSGKRSKKKKETQEQKLRYQDFTYIEPFVGGLNMMESIPPELKRLGFDVNQYLIAMWKGLQQGMKPIANQDFNKEYYKKMYEEYKELLHYDYSSIVNKGDVKDEMFQKIFNIGYAGFVGGYNGKFFGAFMENTTTNYGKVIGVKQKGRDYVDERSSSIYTQLPYVKDVTLQCTNCFKLFEYLISTDRVNPKRTIIYCDPPYRSTMTYKIMQEPFDYDLFYTQLQKLSHKGFMVYISEYWMPPEDFVMIWNKKIYKKVALIENTNMCHEKLYVPKNQADAKPPQALF
jgi:DNA adenine methylase